MSSSDTTKVSNEKIKVLLVHGGAELGEEIRRSLEEVANRLSVEAVSSAEDGLVLLENGEFDAVVSGYELPGMNGLEFLGTLRNRGNKIPFVLFTKVAREEIARKALNLGANRYLKAEDDPKSQCGDLADAVVGEVECRKTEKELIRKSSFLESMLENFPASIYIKDGKGRILMASNRMKEDLRDAGHEEILGKTDFDLFSNELAEGAREWEEQVMKTGEPVTIVEQDTAYDGSEIYLSTTKAPVRDEDGNVIGTIGVTRDITERKATGEALRKAEREKKWILDSTSELIIHQDLEHRVKWMNKVARDLFGEDFESRKGKGPKCYDLVFGLENPCENCPIEDSLEAGETRSREMAFNDGKTWLIRGNPARNEDGDIVRVVEVAKDITEKREAEERIEFLHSLLRHDLRNKIQVIQGYQELLRDTHPSEKQEEYIEKTMKTAQSGVGLIEKVRSLARIEEEEMEEIDIDSTIENLISEKEEQASERGIEINYEKRGCKVWAGQLLKALFSNLIENSIQHSGCDRIKISVQRGDDECIIIIEDDGKGIPEEDKERIFKKEYKNDKSAGSGLGLFLVKEIAKAYGGGVEVKDSKLGGARFDVRLERA